MDNQKENIVFKEEDAKLRDETSDGSKSEREIESDNQQDKAISNGESLHKSQEEQDTNEDAENDDEDDVESVEDKDDEETADANAKKNGTGL